VSHNQEVNKGGNEIETKKIKQNMITKILYVTYSMTRKQKR
jgi:hypothetical protein